MQQTSWVPLAIVALLAGMTFWLDRVANTRLPSNPAGFSHDTDYVVENFSATTFDEQGHPHYRLSANKMAHYMDDDSTELEMPNFERHAVDSAPIHVSSRRGLITASGEDVYFLGDTRIERPARPGQPALVIEADYIRVIPDADILRTDKPITVRQGASIIQATGLFIDGEKHIMQLAGRVKATYEKRN
jgi:lipopolysaccharide export system protein LptC